MIDTQNYYREQIIKHRYGPKTFSIDLKQIGEVNISVVQGKKKLKEYTNIDLLENDLPNKDRLMFGDNDNIQVIFLGGSFGFDALFEGLAASVVGFLNSVSISEQAIVFILEKWITQLYFCFVVVINHRRHGILNAQKTIG